MKRTAEKVLAFISGILGIILALIGIITIILFRLISNDSKIIEGPEFDEYRETLLTQVESLSAYTYIAALALLVASILSLIAALKLTNENNKKIGTYLIVSSVLFLIAQSWVFAVLTVIAGVMAIRRNDELDDTNFR